MALAVRQESLILQQAGTMLTGGHRYMAQHRVRAGTAVVTANGWEQEEENNLEHFYKLLSELFFLFVCFFVFLY